MSECAYMSVCMIVRDFIWRSCMYGVAREGYFLHSCWLVCLLFRCSVECVSLCECVCVVCVVCVCVCVCVCVRPQVRGVCELLEMIQEKTAELSHCVCV